MHLFSKSRVTSARTDTYTPARVEEIAISGMTGVLPGHALTVDPEGTVTQSDRLWMVSLLRSILLTDEGSFRFRDGIGKPKGKSEVAAFPAVDGWMARMDQLIQAILTGNGPVLVAGHTRSLADMLAFVACNERIPWDVVEGNDDEDISVLDNLIQGQETDKPAAVLFIVRESGCNGIPTRAELASTLKMKDGTKIQALQAWAKIALRCGLDAEALKQCRLGSYRIAAECIKELDAVGGGLQTILAVQARMTGESVADMVTRQADTFGNNLRWCQLAIAALKGGKAERADLEAWVKNQAPKAESQAETPTLASHDPVAWVDGASTPAV